jgi:hypothetical protein
VVDDLIDNRMGSTVVSPADSQNRPVMPALP